MGNGVYLSKLTGVESESTPINRLVRRLTIRRAGCPPDSQQMKDLLRALSKSKAVELFGFYSRTSFLPPHSSLHRLHDCNVWRR
jgi:hypothetical protein